MRQYVKQKVSEEDFKKRGLIESDPYPGAVCWDIFTPNGQDLATIFATEEEIDEFLFDLTYG